MSLLTAALLLGSLANAGEIVIAMQAGAVILVDGQVLQPAPGSMQVKQQAESEGLHTIFEAAGAEWRQPGCSMCIAMNGDLAQPGQLVVSTSNRNFEGRQGSGARTLLASPLTAAVCAVTGAVTDPVEFLEAAA